MSFMQTEKPTSPITKYLKFNGQEGAFSYWDKDKKESITLKEINFIFLGNRAGVTGWDDRSGSNIYSNAVLNTRKEELRVSASKGGLIATGYYQDIKAEVNAAGGKYTKFLYVLLDGELVRIDIKGAANFIEGETEATWAACGVDTKTNVVSFSKCKEGKKGSIKYKMPIFADGGTIDPKDAITAQQQADVLNQYFKELTKYESAFKNTEEEEVTHSDSPVEESDSPVGESTIKPADLPF